MKTFNDLQFSAHQLFENHKVSRLMFKNGWSISVVFGNKFYSDGISTYECALINPDGELAEEYDIYAYLSQEEVSDLMYEIQQF